MIEAVIAAVPPTIAALAAWRDARRARHQTNGPITELRADVAAVRLWTVDHDLLHRKEN